MVNSKLQSLFRKWIEIAALFVFVLAPATYQIFPEEAKSPLIKPSIKGQFAKLPLSFEKNEGQVDSQVKYLSRGPGYNVFFTPHEIVFSFRKKAEDQEESSSSVLKMQFIGTNQDPLIQGEEELPGKSNYLIGNDSSKWHASIPHFAKVLYKDLYPEIDVIFYGNQRQLEYDICIAPGKDPKDVRFRIEGAEELSVDGEGNLHILTADQQEIQMQKPLVYQMVDDEKALVNGRYTLLEKNAISFDLESYDSSKLLVIDPIVLSYSSFLGGSGTEQGNKIAIDSSGNVYVVGQTNSTNFPTTAGAYKTTYGAGLSDVFITKVNAAGTALVFSTYLGGSSQDIGFGIAVDSSGNVYVVGQTDSGNFPMQNAYSSTLAGSVDAFFTKLNSTGSALMYSTYLGGSGFDQAFGVAVDSSGKAYVTGQTGSLNFPTLNAFQTGRSGSFDAFVSQFDPTASGVPSLLYSTYFGGSVTESGKAIAVDSSGNAYICGTTNSNNLPTTGGVFQPSIGVGATQNGFVAKFNPTLVTTATRVYATYLGGTLFDDAIDIAVDSSGNVYVTGDAESTDFPVTMTAYQPMPSGGSNAFLSKLDSTAATLLYSTYLGGSGGNIGRGIAVDSSGNAFLTGFTSSTDFPVTPDAYQMASGGGTDVFFSKFNPAASGVDSLVYSTYLGGTSTDQGLSIAAQSNGNVAVITGYTSSSTTFPITPGVFQPTFAGSSNDAFVSKFSGFVPPPPPPQCISGFQKKNRFATQSELYNTLTWCASSSSGVVSYHIYRNGVLIESVQASGPFLFEDHDRQRGWVDVYTITAVDSSGTESDALQISLP